MAADPSFAAAVRLGVGLPATAETNLSAPAQSVVVVAAGASGTKIEEIVINAVTTSLTPTTVAGLVYLFLFDATTYSLYDAIPITAVVASATVPPFRTLKRYDNLWIPSGWSLKASQSVAGNASLLKVEAFGGDY